MCWVGCHAFNAQFVRYKAQGGQKESERGTFPNQWLTLVMDGEFDCGKLYVTPYWSTNQQTVAAYVKVCVM